MVLSSNKKKNFLEELEAPVLIDKAQVIRIIERFKTNFTEINPSNIAIELGIPRSFIYEDLDLLEYIYRNALSLNGSDKLIYDLIKELKTYKRKFKRVGDQLKQLEQEKSKAHNDGFLKGAALNYSNHISENSSSKLSPEKLKENWARGVLYIGENETLDEASLKKAYRNIVALLHPDASGKDTSEMMNQARKAYEYLIDKSSLRA